MADMGELLKRKTEIEEKIKKAHPLYNPYPSGPEDLEKINDQIESEKEKRFNDLAKREAARVSNKGKGFGALSVAEAYVEEKRREKEKRIEALKQRRAARIEKQNSGKGFRGLSMAEANVENNTRKEDIPDETESENTPEDKKKKRDWKKTKAFGKGLWTGTKATGRGAKWLGKKGWTGAKATGRGAKWLGEKSWTGAKKGKEKWSDGSSARLIDWIYLIILVTHAIDAFWQFSWAAIPQRLILYTIMIVLICFLLRSHWRENVIPLSGISLFIIFGYPGLLYLLDLINISQNLLTIVVTVMTIFPIIALYFRMVGLTYDFDADGDGLIMATIKAIFFFRFTHWLKIWMTFWTVMAIILLVGGLGNATEELPDLPNTVKVTPTEIVEKVTETVSKAANTVVDSFVTLFSGVSNTYKSYMNTTLGKYYSSQVEENKKDTGVFIDNFRASGNYQEGTEIAFSPIIKTRSFAGDIDLIFNCTAFDTRNKSNVVNGYLNYDKLTLSEDDTRSVICRFNHGKYKDTYLTKGRYRVEFTAEFDFETWAYADYIYMEKDLLQSIRISGDDVNKKFGIPKEPTVVYTSGPAKVGMKEQILDGMPFGLSYDDDSFILVGMTLDNPDKINGEILNVNNFQLRIPKIFTTTDKFCTRKMTPKSPYDDSNSEKYHIYEFEKPDGINLKQTYLTVDCQLTVNKNDAYGLLGGSGGMAQTSMVATANYTYLLKSRTNIAVEENPFLQND